MSPVHATAGHRHFREHVQDPAREARRRDAASQLGVADFMERVLGIADKAQSLGERAASIGDGRTALGALREERESLTVLMSRLGVDSEEALDGIREARALASAVSHVLQDEPLVARALARHLSERGEKDLADSFGRLADSISSRHVARLAQHPKREIA